MFRCCGREGSCGNGTNVPGCRTRLLRVVTSIYINRQRQVASLRFVALRSCCSHPAAGKEEQEDAGTYQELSTNTEESLGSQRHQLLPGRNGRSAPAPARRATPGASLALR